MSWQTFEEKIRNIAVLRWNCNAHTETIAGIKCDCILRVSLDQCIAIEITEENDLAKVRADIAKLWTIKNAFMVEDVFCRCYFVMKDKPTDTMRATGLAQKVYVMSAEEFQNEFFDYKSYIHIRKTKSFGSLINFETGEPETNTYIDVQYRNKRSGEELSIYDIISLLKKGKKVILKGDFGLGKSRCIKQIFDVLTENPVNNPYTIAINLRDHWGARRCLEILTRHFQDLGLDSNNFVKCYENPNTVYLLDGFDEIGTQSWSSDTKKMQHTRELSVCALKDLVCNTRGGVLIAGREYYFNSDSEMLNCLGLTEQNAVILECHHEFTETELIAFVKTNLQNHPNIDKLDSFPIWLPKRPLVMQLLLLYASEIFSTEYALDDICGFWYAFLQRMSEREAKIYPALNPETIKGVLIALATKTRKSVQNTGPISQTDLSNAFLATAGISPTDESAIMLQRLPSLGRVNADSPDRQFLDTFILNGLRAECIIQLSKSWDTKIMSDDWKNPLDHVGLSILAEYIAKDDKRPDLFLGLARQACKVGNKVLASDIVAAICLTNVNFIDFHDLCIDDGYFSYLSFEGKEISRLTLNECIIERFDLTNAQLHSDTHLSRCLISTAYGIASHKSIPDNLVECSVEMYEALATTTLVKKARLSEPQKILVQMLRKIFIQPGAGRMESALLRGMGTSVNRKLCERILAALIDEQLITKTKGDEGYIYHPVRGEMPRIDKIITQLTLSTDPLWLKISQLN